MKRLRFYLVLALAVLPFSPIATHAAEWLVRPDGSGDAPTIQAAIDLASNGDVILLANGVFTGNGNRDISIISKNITIESQSAEPESCIINCEGSAEDQRYGFQLYNYHALGVVMEGFTVSNAYSEAHGGAINWPAGTGPLTVNNCVFSTNTGCDGSGIDVGMSGGGTLVLTDCDFLGNLSTAVQLNEVGEVQITNCNFIGNTGAGVSLRETTNITISHCTFADNYAYYGAGILFGDDSAGLVTNCIFIGNVANWGGGIGCDDSSPIIESCTFYANRAEDSGGGVRSLAFFGEAAVNISKTIIASSTNGGAVACAGTGTAMLQTCDVYGNTGGDWVDCISGQLGVDGNISEPPLFCDAVNGDLTLHEDSPCLPENNDSGELIGALEQGCPGPTGIADDPRAPNTTSVLRVYPNPFNPTVRIEYSVPIPGPVRLAIYSIRGHLVRLLVDDMQTRGERAVYWRGRDDSGAEVSTGVYFVRLEVSGQDKTRKIVLLK